MKEFCNCYSSFHIKDSFTYERAIKIDRKKSNSTQSLENGWELVMLNGARVLKYISFLLCKRSLLLLLLNCLQTPQLFPCGKLPKDARMLYSHHYQVCESSKQAVRELLLKKNLCWSQSYIYGYRSNTDFIEQNTQCFFPDVLWRQSGTNSLSYHERKQCKWYDIKAVISSVLHN